MAEGDDDDDLPPSDDDLPPSEQGDVVPSEGQHMAETLLLGEFQIDHCLPLHISSQSVVVGATSYTTTDGEASQHRQRALKAMRNIIDVQAELDGRADVDPNQIVAVCAVFVDEAVKHDDLQVLRNTAERTNTTVISGVQLSACLQRDLTERCTHVCSSSMAADGLFDAFHFMLVLEHSGRTLMHTMMHNHIFGGTDTSNARVIAANLANRLDHLHSFGRIHGDFNPHNVVFADGMWRLIDLETSSAIGEVFHRVPRGGYVAPELAQYVLDPNVCEDNAYGKTSVALDLWSFGIVLLQLVFGCSSWTINPDGLELDEFSLHALARTQSIDIRKRLWRACKCPSPKQFVAMDLICRLLEPEPTARLNHFASHKGREMTGVLEHAFFQENSENVGAMYKSRPEIFATIHDLNIGNLCELQILRELLLKDITETFESNSPAALVILPSMLPHDERSLSIQEKDMLQALPLNMHGTGFTGDQSLVELATDAKIRFEQALRWIELLRSFDNEEYDADPTKVLAIIREACKELQITTKDMHLYLIDELTGKPHRNGSYPIQISASNECIAHLVPLMLVTMRAVTMYNGVEGLVRMFGGPSAVPVTWRDSVQDSIELLKDRRFFGFFKAAHLETSLKALCALLEQDGSLRYAGMNRVIGEGYISVWTSANLLDVKHIIEERAEQRRQEQQRHEAFVTAKMKLLVKLEVERGKHQLQGEMPVTPSTAGSPHVPLLNVELVQLAQMGDNSASGEEAIRRRLDVDEDGDGVPDVAKSLQLMVDADGDGISDGLHTDKLGLFVPQVGMQNDRPFYANHANDALLIWWSGGRWWLGKRDELGHNRGWLKVQSLSIVPPESGWLVYNKKDKAWEIMEGLVCNFAERIVLDGDTPGGVHADKLGAFVRCSNTYADRPVFTREGHGGKWNLLLWWHAGKWHVGKRADLGSTKGWLRLVSNAYSPAGLNGWIVYSAKDKLWLQAPDLKCVSSNAANAAAKGGAPPPPTEEAVDLIGDAEPVDGGKQ